MNIFKPLSFCLISTLSFHPIVYAGAISPTPLFLTTSSKSNTLVILDNSNSMDEDASGAAVGSNSPNSKSEIARSVIRNLVSTYNGQINMGLMTYQQDTANIKNWYLHNSPYDATYNSANYNPNFTGARDSLTKRFRIPNPTSPGNYIYYNVALPSYANYNQGNQFCYAPDAKAFNNGEDPNNGPWNPYRCFTSKTGTKDIWDIDPTNPWRNNALETTLGYSGFVWEGAFFPTDSDLAQGILDFGKQLTSHYVSRTYYVDGSPGRGFLNNPIRLLDNTQASALNTNLACNIPTTPAPCTVNGIKNAGLTPIEGTLLTAKDYFNGSLSSTAEGYAASGTKVTYPLPQSCNKNFVIMITDGLPSNDKNGNLIATPATAIAAAATAAASLKADGVNTYVVGFALPYGTDPTTLDTIAQAGGTQTAFVASDYNTLSDALNAIYNDIINKSYSFSTLANNGPKLDTSSLIYQATFDAKDWSGNVNAFEPAADGTLNTTPYWQAASKIPSPTDRNIFTYNPSAPSTGVKGMAFQWANLSNSPSGSSQQDYLNTLNSINDGKGQDRLNWLRGDQTKEKLNGGTFRNRTNILGDIVSSNPIFVSHDDYDFVKLPGLEGTNYPIFRSSSTYTSRIPMLYVGANDGMFHGFDAQKSATGGTELLAYVPNVLFPQLSKLTATNYLKQAYVDGLNTTSDAYVDIDANGVSEWHTLLTGSTGAGARAVFTLDVTNPSSFGSNNVLWEFNDSNDADLGYTMTQPALVRMHGGKWGVVVANGYNSSNGKAVLFILDAATGAVIKKIDTGSGSTSNPNGLSNPLAVDLDSDHIYDVIYAGDLLGNLWKFDISSETTSSWDAAYKSGTTAQPLFVACVNPGSSCAATDRQPITSKPTIGPVGTDQSGGVMIYFGTGKYFETTDNVIGSNPQVQAFYGLWDKNTKTASTDQITDASQLQNQTINTEAIATSANNVTSVYKMRITSNNTFCYSATSTACTATSTLKRGWMIKLTSPPGFALGERVVDPASLLYKTIIFSTTTPSSSPCKSGCNSWKMYLDSLTGQRKKETVFDAFGETSTARDNVVTNADMIKDTSNNDELVSITGINKNNCLTGATLIMTKTSTGSGMYSNPNGTDLNNTGGFSTDTNNGTDNRIPDGSTVIAYTNKTGSSVDSDDGGGDGGGRPDQTPIDLCKSGGACFGAGMRRSWRQLR